jgi:hypothetical protein
MWLIFELDGQVWAHSSSRASLPNLGSIHNNIGNFLRRMIYVLKVPIYSRQSDRV